MRRSAVMLALALLAAGCSSSHHSSASPAPVAPSSTIASALTATRIPWAHLRNPIFRNATHAVKDPALVQVGDQWVLLYSQVDHKGSWRIGVARSTDLAHWKHRITMPHDPHTEGEASPDIVRAPDGSFVVTYQSFVHDRGRGQSKLYARTTTDFRTYSAPTKLAIIGLDRPRDRLIDPALAYTPAGLLLGYKVGTTDAGATQAFEIARSRSGTLAGPWQRVGRPKISVYGDTIENYQFTHLDGRWLLLATSNQFDRPELFTLAGNANDPHGWLRWSKPVELNVPKERWNTGRGLTGSTYEHANCAFIVDSNRNPDGYYYLVYSDAPQMGSFGAQGHAVIAIARARAVTGRTQWSVPPR